MGHENVNAHITHTVTHVRRVAAAFLRYSASFTVFCRIWPFIHVEDDLQAAARAGAPLRRAPGGAEAPRREGASVCGARVGSGVRECARARARQRGPLASNSLRREFEGNSGIPFEGNSKGTRRVLEVLRVVSGTSCNHHLALPRIGCAFPFQRPLKEFEEAWTATSAFTSAEASHGLPLTTLTTQGVLRILDNNDGFKPSTP